MRNHNLSKQRSGDLKQQGLYDPCFEHDACGVGMRNNNCSAGGQYKWRRTGEVHQYNPMSIAKLQQATRSVDTYLTGNSVLPAKGGADLPRV